MSQIADAQHCLREGENTTIRGGSAQPMNVYFGGFPDVARMVGFKEIPDDENGRGVGRAKVLWSRYRFWYDSSILVQYSWMQLSANIL
jgi:hypothetical protein